MPTAYFLGAGASAADGLPVTNQLNFGVADWLKRSPSRGAELWTYYNTLYGLGRAQFSRAAGCWRAYLKDRRRHPLPQRGELPDLVETLSLIDVCISEEHSLGLSASRGRRRPCEMNPGFLRKVRQQLTYAVADAVQKATYRRRSTYTTHLVAALEEGDVLISTNWDILLDRCLVAAWKKRRATSWLKESPIRYHCVGERPVNWRGNDLKGTVKSARSLLRLHGALNWFGCAACGTVYVNLESSYVMNEQNRRKDYDECHCGAGLLNVMIAPSYLKDYRNISLRSVWREAQTALAVATRWVFIGYSLPSDDFHIRAMLMRAFRSGPKRSRGRRLRQISVYLGEDSHQAAARYQDFFRIDSKSIKMSGFTGWVDAQVQARRS